MTKNIDSQKLIKDVKAALGMTTSELAMAFGFNERTVNSWLLPKTSPGYRSMPDTSIKLLLRSISPNKSNFSHFDVGVHADPDQAIKSRDNLVEFPQLYLLKIRDKRLSKETCLIKHGDNYYTTNISPFHYHISFSENPSRYKSHQKDFEILEVSPFTFVTQDIAKAIGQKHLYIAEMADISMATGFIEAIVAEFIRTKDDATLSSVITCVLNGRYFIAYLADSLDCENIKNYTYFQTLNHWAEDGIDSSLLTFANWTQCIDTSGLVINIDDGEKIDPSWVPVTLDEAILLRKTLGEKLEEFDIY